MFGALFLLAVSTLGFAAISEDLTKNNFRVSVCNIADMTVSFKIDQSFGEPLITSKMQWQAGPNTSRDCLSKITQIWLQVRTQTDGLTYMKLSPTISAAGVKLDTSTTESPNWTTLFCSSPKIGSPCESIVEAKRLMASNLKFESFEVTSDTLATSNIGSVSSPTSNTLRTDKSKSSFSLDSLLADAIDTVVKPQNDISSEQQQSETNVVAKPLLNPQETAQNISDQKEEEAKTALNSVVTLISSSLAQYTTPAHNCESERKVANWVQVRGSCQLNFRSTSSHNFLCADSGKPEPITTTNAASINFANGLNAVSDIRISSDGWASISLELSDEFHNQSEGNYKSNRWYFTTEASQLNTLQQLAGSILTLKSYCESQS
ncbi:MAG: hypothetical protein ACJAVI_002110 [Candidatus Azotimanducaceae bacterium]|jgi:hypothetical protein